LGDTELLMIKMFIGLRSISDDQNQVQYVGQDITTYWLELEMFDRNNNNLTDWMDYI